MNQPEVKIYTTATCVYCHAEKKYLREHNIPYTEIPVDSDIEAAKEMVQLTHQMGVPVTVIKKGESQEFVIGFDQPRLNQLLGISG